MRALRIECLTFVKVELSASVIGEACIVVYQGHFFLYFIHFRPFLLLFESFVDVDLDWVEYVQGRIGLIVMFLHSVELTRTLRLHHHRLRLHPQPLPLLVLQSHTRILLWYYFSKSRFLPILIGQIYHLLPIILLDKGLRSLLNLFNVTLHAGRLDYRDSPFGVLHHGD